MLMSKVSLTVAEDVRYTVLRIGDRKRQTHDVPSAEEWDDVCTFFIYNLGQEEVGLAYSVRVCLALRLPASIAFLIIIQICCNAPRYNYIDLHFSCGSKSLKSLCLTEQKLTRKIHCATSLF